jgi:hypothetical protein
MHKLTTDIHIVMPSGGAHGKMYRGEERITDGENEGLVKSSSLSENGDDIYNLK